MFIFQVRHDHRPSWISRLRDLRKRNESVPASSSLDEIDLRSTKIPKLPQINDKDSSYSEGYHSARDQFGRERNFFAKGHADKVKIYALFGCNDTPSVTV